MNIYQRLKQDHERQRALAQQLAATSGNSADRRQLFEQFRVELEAHASAEEQTLYAALIADAAAQDQARHSIVEHKELASLVEELQDMSMSNGAWLQKFEQLKHDVIHHLDEEERDVFPMARDIIGDVDELSLATEFEARKEREMNDLVEQDPA